MESLHTAPQRQVPSAQDRKRADATVAPFLKALKGWNAKAAHLAVRATSAYSSPEDATLARLEGGALLVEVRRRYSEFQAAIKGEPPHGRLDDVGAAFERLMDQLHVLSKAS